MHRRLYSLRNRRDELLLWRWRDYELIDGWSSAGRAVRIGELWPEGPDVVELKCRPHSLPTDWPLDCTRLHLSTGGEGTVTLEYEDHPPQTFRLDWQNEHFPLRSNRFWITLEAGRYRSWGRPNTGAALRHAQVIWHEPAVERLARLLSLAIEAAEALEEEELQESLLDVADRALRDLEWPSGTRDYLSRLSTSPQMRRLRSLPAGLNAHPPALNAAEVRSVETGYQALASDLSSLAVKYPAQGRLALVGHVHIDLAWLEPMHEARRRTRANFHSTVDLLRRHKDYRFVQSSALLHKFIEEDDPALFQEIRELVATRRWEIVGGMWVEPDTNMPTGESLARQLLWGQRYFESRFGRLARVGWLPDSFGFSPALPQLLLSAGLTSFFTTKLRMSDTNVFPYHSYWWRGLDGSRIPVHMSHSPQGYNTSFKPSVVVNSWKQYQNSTLHPEALQCLGFGGGQPPSEDMLLDYNELRALPKLPELEFVDVEAFFNRLECRLNSAADPPTWVGELYLEEHRGTYTTQGRTKYLHRRAEQSLLGAEVLMSLRTLWGGPTPTPLSDLWEVLLRNQFHDILPGTSIREVVEEAEREMQDVVAVASALIRDQLAALVEEHSREGEEECILVVNTELSTRPMRITSSVPLSQGQAVEAGYVYTSAERVQGLSGRLLRASVPSTAVEVQGLTMENDLLRVELGDQGHLRAVLDKRAGREVVSGPSNRLWVYVDKPSDWEAWNLDADYRQNGRLLTADDVSVVETGPHRGAIRVRYVFRDSVIEQDVRLWAGSARIDFYTRISWHDRRWLLRAHFPLQLAAARAYSECAFGVVERPTHRNTSWEQAMYEFPAHRFVDLAEADYGVALLNDSRHGYQVQGDEVSLSLLRSPVYPDPLADEGEQALTYSLMPHAGSWMDAGVLMEAQDLNRPLFAAPYTGAGEGTLRGPSLRGHPVALAALKPSEDDPDQLIMRTYEPGGSSGSVEVTLPAGWVAAAEVDVLEGECGPPEKAYRPFQIHSWLLTRNPAQSP